MSSRRASIEVTLDCDAALELIAASFAAAARTNSPNWWEQHGWAVERGDRELLAFPTDVASGVLEVPQHLGVRVQVTPLSDGGARVEAKLVWLPRRVARVVAFGVASVFESLGVGLVMASLATISARRWRKAAKRRMLRLALEPLLAHQRARDKGPFRRSS